MPGRGDTDTEFYKGIKAKQRLNPIVDKGNAKRNGNAGRA